MTDAELLDGFRAATLTSFRHVDHVRVAWLYLLRGEKDRFAADLQRFAAAHGASAKYDEAITRAWLERIEARPRAASWPEFAEANPDLMTFTRSAARDR